MSEIYISMYKIPGNYLEYGSPTIILIKMYLLYKLNVFILYSTRFQNERMWQKKTRWSAS